MTRNDRAHIALALGAVLLIAGCGDAPPSTMPSVAHTTATTVAPTAPPGSEPAATPATAPTTGPGDSRAALAAFAARVNDPALSYRLRQTGSLAAAGTSVKVAYDLEIAGRNFSAVMTVGDETTEIIGVDGTGYLKGADGSWTTFALTDEVLADIVNPWQYLGALNDLEFGGPADSPDGALLFANSGPIVYQTGAMRRSGVVGAINRLTFVVMPDGTPVAIDFTAESPDGQGGTLAIEARVEFADVGEAITIEAPRP